MRGHQAAELYDKKNEMSEELKPSESFLSFLKKQESGLIKPLGEKTWRKEKVYFIDEILEFIDRWNTRPEIAPTESFQEHYNKCPASCDEITCQYHDFKMEGNCADSDETRPTHCDDREIFYLRRKIFELENVGSEPAPKQIDEPSFDSIESQEAHFELTHDSELRKLRKDCKPEEGSGKP